jgi:hypothetical protein
MIRFTWFQNSKLKTQKSKYQSVGGIHEFPLRIGCLDAFAKFYSLVFSLPDHPPLKYLIKLILQANTSDR